MNSILSIDFDYFIDVSAKDRGLLFPPSSKISSGMSSRDIEDMWEECYYKHPEILKIGVIEDYYFISEYLKNHKRVPYRYSESHDAMFNFTVSNLSTWDKTHITNIDFHHDYYYMFSGSKVTPANWMMMLDSNGKISDVLWVSREDSETTSIGGEFKYPRTTDIRQIKDRYDGIFLCFSPEWTPPHLRPCYDNLVMKVMR